MTRFDTIVLGASGYVGAECLRLIEAHPRLALKAAVSESKAGATVLSLFPHLASSRDVRFRAPSEIPFILKDARSPVAVLSAASHGASAPLIAQLLEAAAAVGVDVRVVDLSADFRYREASSYEAIYKSSHGAPAILPSFESGLPEHVELIPRHAGHPGCFTTSVLLAVVPLLKLGIVEPEIFAFGITGSTGSGREPRETTHHPERHSNLFAYQPLVHRHVPEMIELAEKASGLRPKIHFVPHSGPFARGIHTTIQGRLKARLPRRRDPVGARPLLRGLAAGPRRPGSAPCERRGGELLRESRRRDRRRYPRGLLRHRQPAERRGGRRSPMVEPHVGPSSIHGPHAAGAGVDSDDCDRSRPSAPGVPAASARPRLRGRRLSPNRGRQRGPRLLRRPCRRGSRLRSSAVVETLRRQSISMTFQTNAVALEVRARAADKLDRGRARRVDAGLLREQRRRSQRERAPARVLRAAGP